MSTPLSPAVIADQRAREALREQPAPRSLLKFALVLKVHTPTLGTVEVKWSSGAIWLGRRGPYEVSWNCDTGTATVSPLPHYDPEKPPRFSADGKTRLSD